MNFFRKLADLFGGRRDLYFSNCTFNGVIDEDFSHREHVIRKQLMVFRNVKDHPGGLIGNICLRPLPIVFQTDELAPELFCLDLKDHAAVVDVVSMKAEGRPVAYKIMAVHGAVPIDEDE